MRYKSQVYTTIWSEQLNKEERELKREENLNTRDNVSPGGRGKKSRAKR
jgi:hypothetical protein